jgi:hypothetical protein
VSVHNLDLTYSITEPGEGITPDPLQVWAANVQLAEVTVVTAWRNQRTDARRGEDICIWLRGRILRKDGTPGKRSGSLPVDVLAAQPVWLAELIEDARARLA